MSTHGRYQLADLALTYQGSFKELVKMQKIEREFQAGVHDLVDASGCDPEDVHLIIDEGKQSPRGGTFDMYRLRVVHEGKLWTIDVSSSDKHDHNPLGVYLDRDKPIEVYSFDEERVVNKIDRGNSFEDGAARNQRTQKNPQPAQQQGQAQQPQQRQQRKQKAQENQRRLGDNEEEIADGQRQAINRLLRKLNISESDLMNGLHQKGWVPTHVTKIDSLTYAEAKQAIKGMQNAKN